MTLWVSHREENHPEDAEEAEAGVVSAAAAEVAVEVASRVQAAEEEAEVVSAVAGDAAVQVAEAVAVEAEVAAEAE